MGLGKKSRLNIKYYRRLLQRECGVVKLSITEPISHEESTRIFDTFLHIEQSGWKGQKGTSLAQIEKGRLFHKGLCDTASDDGLLRWYQLFAGEKLVSMNVVMCRGSTLWVMKTAYDENFRRYSPGTLGLTELLKTAIEDPQIHTVRMITNYPWLDKWRPDKESYMGVRIFLPSIPGRMASLATSLLKKDWKVLV
jgi:CelD/BcsL family acetyltransferase involved in cellulose biosynthesis